MNTGTLIATGIRFISVYIAWTGFNSLRNGGFLYAQWNYYYKVAGWFFPDQKIAHAPRTAWEPYLTYSIIAFIVASVLWYFSGKLAVLFTKGLPEKSLRPGSTAIEKLSISRDSVEIGEWTEEQVRSLYMEGKLLAADYYWKEGMTEWAKLSKMIKPTPPKSSPEVVSAVPDPKWYLRRKRAEQGHALSQYILGMCYHGGIGVEKDEGEAVKWFRKAADQGDAQAQFVIWGCYANGIGVERDEDEAVKWLRKAAEQGHTAAQSLLNEH